MINSLTYKLISSFIFATIHFLRNKTDGDFSNPQWYTGFSYLFTTLQNYTNPEFLGSYLTLFTCGAFLSLVSLHYGNIARCIGIHCGWVIVISGLKKVTDDTPDEDTPYWWMIGNYDKVTGYLAFAIIALFCFSYWFLLMSNKTTENEIE